MTLYSTAFFKKHGAKGGKIGGSKSTPAKAKAARENGRKRKKIV